MMAMVDCMLCESKSQTMYSPYVHVNTNRMEYGHDSVAKYFPVVIKLYLMLETR